MKKFKLLIILSFLAYLNSCTNYEHGPVVSFLNANTRIAGEWELTDVIINDKTDNVLLSEESNVKYTFCEQGTIIAVYTNMTRNLTENTGTWQFNDDKTEIIVSFDTNSEQVLLHCNNYKILRLTNDELWISDETAQVKQCEYIIERRYTKITE
ncbi:MAG TPA: DUF5004 domain-containing protein [Bacteroidales bacterium]|nr:DUF5004 domain-containing protein [Bacteroidales bacterium]